MHRQVSTEMDLWPFILPRWRPQWLGLDRSMTVLIAKKMPHIQDEAKAGRSAFLRVSEETKNIDPD